MGTKEQIYPKIKKGKPEKILRWRVDYALLYEGSLEEWSQQYYTRMGAKVSAWINFHINSYGGKAILVEQKPLSY